MARSICVALAIVLLCAPAWCAIAINCSGAYVDVVDRNDLQGAGGSNLNKDYESAVNAGLLSITGAGAANWHINVHRSDTSWNPALALWIRRTTPLDPYQLITLTDTLFISGTGNTSNIAFQVKITGMSVTIPVSMYANSIILTVVSP